MSTNIKKTLAALVMGAMFMIAAPTTQADTMADLQAQIAALMAQIAALTGNTTTTNCVATYNHTVTLRAGSTGSQVMAMQAVIGATADGKFGPMTATKLKAFQASKGLVADGIAGPATGAALHTASMGTCSTTTTPGGTTTTGGTLSGGIGMLKSSPSVLSQYNNEEIGEGQNDIAVAGWEFEAETGSDLRVSSLRLKFDGTSNGVNASKIFNRYAKDVSIWLDGKMVGEVDASDFSKDGTGVYSTNVNLDSSAIISAGQKARLVIGVSAQNVIDSNNLNADAWNVTIQNIRYSDASGAILTESYTMTGVQMDFTSFLQSANTKLKLSTDSNSPKAGVVIVSETKTTNDVALVKGKIKLEGSSDVTIDSFPVTFTTANATGLSNVTGSVTLVLDGQKFRQSVTSTAPSASIVFDNLDFVVEAGDTVNFEVWADINKIGGGGIDAGDDIKASVSGINLNNIDVINDQGDQLGTSSTDRSGSVTGEVQTFRVSGIDVSFVSSTASVNQSTGGNNDTGTFTIKFKVTAVGDNVYVGKLVANAASYTVDVGGTATGAGLSSVIVNNTDTNLSSSGDNYMIEDGQSETFTLTIARTNSSGSTTPGLTRASLNEVYWNLDDSTSYKTYDSNMSAFHTDYVSLD